MKQTRKILAAVLCTVMMLSLCACGAQSRNTGSGEGYAAQTSAAYQANEAVMYDYDEAAVAAMDYGGFAPAPMAAAGTSMTSAKEESTGAEQQSETAEDLNPEKIIYSGDATIETTEFDGTLSALESLIESCGGWIESSSVNGSKYASISRGTAGNRSASYTVRVPNEKFSAVMGELSSLGNIPYSHVYT